MKIDAEKPDASVKMREERFVFSCVSCKNVEDAVGRRHVGGERGQQESDFRWGPSGSAEIAVVSNTAPIVVRCVDWGNIANNEGKKQNAPKKYQEAHDASTPVT